MLQQTQVKTVVPYWERWMKALPTIEALANAKPEKVLKLWEGLGYYTRARNLHRAAKIICEECGGEFPDDFEGVLALPGIGRYTAGAICSIAFNQPTAALDGNTTRVLCRIFGIDQNPRSPAANRKLWDLAQELVSQAARLKAPRTSLRHVQKAGNCAQLNQALMELGAVICTPHNAGCRRCPVKRLCRAYGSGRVEELPNLDRRVPSTRRRMAAFVVEEQGRVLVRQRPAGVVNGEFWEFPNVELSPKDVDLHTVVRDLFHVEAKRVEGLYTVRHTITRYRITVEVYRAVLKGRPKVVGQNCRWAKLAELSRLPFCSAHRKIASVLAGSPENSQ